MIKKSTKWLEMYEAAYEHNDRNCCSVVALAISAGWSYENAWSSMRTAGRKKGRGATVRTSIEALENSKIKHEILDMNDMHDIRREMDGKRLTTNQFAKMFNKGTYQVMIRGHIFAMIDGVVHDFENSGKHEVLCAIKILKDAVNTLPKVTFKEQGELYARRN